MRVLIAGASGFIGAPLTRELEGAGHQVSRLVRRVPSHKREIAWSPASGILDFRKLEQFDAVINLSGASLSKLPWTKKYRREILSSRIHATRTLTDAMRQCANPPSVFASASAVGIYGDQPGVLLTEDSPAGDGFLADVVDQWERAAALAPEGTRVVTFRTGMVLGQGGALKPLTQLTRLGLGARLGEGTQVWPWVSLTDEARAITHLLEADLSGPVNVAGPRPATANEITKCVAEVLARPHLFAVPRRVLELMLGDAAQELLLSSQRVSAQRLTESGFTFTHPTAEDAIRSILNSDSAKR